MTNAQPHEKDGRVTVPLATWADYSKKLPKNKFTNLSQYVSDVSETNFCLN